MITGFVIEDLIELFDKQLTQLGIGVKAILNELAIQIPNFALLGVGGLAVVIAGARQLFQVSFHMHLAQRMAAEPELLGIVAKQREIWDLYRQFGEYRLNPDAKLRESLIERFDQIFNDKTCYHSLNLLLEHQRAKKSDLLFGALMFEQQIE